MFNSRLLSLIVLAVCMDAAPVSYDQSQSGDLNVQVDLKGLNIIAFMKSGKEEYVDYDYAYDYSEMTIKPHKSSTTPKPMNATSSITLANTTLNFTSTPDPSFEQTTLLTETTQNATTLSTSTEIAEIKRTSTDTPEMTTIRVMTEETELPLSPPSPIAIASASDCKKGFAPNQKGECELKLQNVGTNALLKLVKLSQKLKLRRERDRT